MGGRVEGSCMPRGRIWGKHFGTGTMLERGHPVDEAGLGGGVAGAEPPHKGGPNRPDRPELQWLVISGQWSETAQSTMRA